ncbi:GlmU family protein [candidate division KSB1 bacterium]|nr:GlmU family protein [candidate division KSB1 bacterium]
MNKAASHLCIYEDANFSKLYPLTLTRPVFDLRCGIFSLNEKLLRRFPQESVYLLCRKYLEEIVKNQHPDVVINELPDESTKYCLFINGRLLADAEFLNRLEMDELIYTHKGTIVAALLGAGNRQRLIVNKHNIVDFKETKDVQTVEIEANLINYPWDLVHQNSKQIETDFADLGEGGQSLGNVSKDAILLNSPNIRIGINSVIKAGAVLDAEHGPIYIGENATIMSNAVIEGPAFMGDNSIFKIGAKIYPGTSIGEWCKVGGEVEETIFHAFSSKQHDGFLGHSYLGQWVNLGADTNNSNLKNNYSSVRLFIDGEFIDSGSQFVGLFMGDHCKSGINTMFNTGTVVGAMSNIYGGGFPPKNIPSFAWGGSDGFVEHDLEKALETARMVMARRGVEMTADYEKMIRNIFDLTKAGRQVLAIQPSKA